MVRIRGSYYALAIMFQDNPDEIYVAKKDSPMILGVSDGNSYVAPDVPAFLKYMRNSGRSRGRVPDCTSGRRRNGQ